MIYFYRGGRIFVLFGEVIEPLGIISYVYAGIIMIQGNVIMMPLHVQ